MTAGRDKLFKTLGDPGLFSFNEAVVGVFPDMIRRSVPGYSTVIAMTGLLAGKHAQPGTNIYDLGCSLGASMLSASHHLQDHSIKLIGVDNSAPMIENCRNHIADNFPSQPFELVEADITDIEIENASVVIMNYTLQFVPVEKRDALMKKIRAALRPGGALILSEKIELAEPAMNELMIDLYHDFKRAQGYSDLEVAQKRQALENVLIPDTRERHIERLRASGFHTCDFWFQCFNFASLIAIA